MGRVRQGSEPLVKEPRCNNSHDHECYKQPHAANTSRNPFSLYGRECPVHGPNAVKPRLPDYEGSSALSKPCKDCEPVQAEPKPDPYVSPHSTDAKAAARNYVKAPVYEEVPALDLNTVALNHTGYDYLYPHQDWLNARDQFAKDGTWKSLNAVLMHVTETNPPPGPPIPVYKPAQPVSAFHPLIYVGLILCVISVAIGCFMLLL